MHVIFSHGKESGPNGNKIIQLRKVAEALGCTTESVDYQGLDNPQDRVERLIKRLAVASDEVVLVGSSMGGYVSVAAAAINALNRSADNSEKPRIKAVFLLVPAVFMAGYPEVEELEQLPPMSIVHGWKDDVVPYKNSLRLAEQCHADYHLLDDGHRLKEVLPQVVKIFHDFLEPVMK